MSALPKAKCLMFMGTGSDVGKSLIVAGLCRALANRGISVAPFKPQNMSNNAAVTSDGGEIGRAQALQARAARLQPITAMNPVLLKPEHDSGAQIIVRGQRRDTLPAKDYFAKRAALMPEILSSFTELSNAHDMILMEGAGSASEINLREHDIANFGFARTVRTPVTIIGDIDRGGVIASLVGTLNVIDPRDADLVVATLVNNFRGDPSLFAKGMTQIADLTARPVFGPVPHFTDAHKLPQEDALGLSRAAPASPRTSSDQLTIAVPLLSRIANFDDFDPLRSHPEINLLMVPPGQPIPRKADLIIIPGSKATIADLAFMRAEGWDIDIMAHARAGGRVLGICGGYQMLGTSIADPEGIEGPPAAVEGLGLLDVTTVLAPQKQLRIETGSNIRHGTPVTGYHMHMGVTTGPDTARPFANVNGQHEGAISADGAIQGTYLHGLFVSDPFRHAFLTDFGTTVHPQNHERMIDQVLDGLANHLETHLDIDHVLGFARAPQLN